MYLPLVKLRPVWQMAGDTGRGSQITPVTPLRRDAASRLIAGGPSIP